jgi:hypothetical protein
VNLKLKGQNYVMDDLCNTNNSLAAGDGNKHHDGRFNSYPAGGGHRFSSGECHFRPEMKRPNEKEDSNLLN